jgi:hypothetical protein
MPMLACRVCVYGSNGEFPTIEVPPESLCAATPRSALALCDDRLRGLRCELAHEKHVRRWSGNMVARPRNVLWYHQFHQSVHRDGGYTESLTCHTSNFPFSSSPCSLSRRICHISLPSPVLLQFSTKVAILATKQPLRPMPNVLSG